MGFWAFSWILIPIAGIMAGAFKEWLQFKEKQNQLGTSTEKLEQKVEKLLSALKESESQRETLVERIQNLETIVTSQEWDSLDDQLTSGSTLKLSEKEKNQSPLLDSTDFEEKSSTHSMNQAARLAKRLGT